MNLLTQNASYPSLGFKEFHNGLVATKTRFLKGCLLVCVFREQVSAFLKW